MIHLDSHVVVWAYGKRSRLSSLARRMLASEACLISPAVLLEIDGLFELGRIAVDARTIVSGFRRQIELTISQTSFMDVVNAAREFAWTHEPFDRLIVGNAIADGSRLLTADEHILDHFRDAVW